ncbi:MAG: DUF362 domain-containing protein [Syntrophales bacterium]
MKRRDFLRGAAALSALAMVSGSDNLGAGQAPQPLREGGTPVAAQRVPVWLAGVARGAAEAAIKAAVRDAALAATDFSWLAKGDSVFIKPALNSGFPYPYTTSPVAMAAVVELLREKGARRVIVGDMCGIGHVKLSPDGLSGSSRRLMEAAGMAAAVRAAGAELHFFEEAGWDAFYEDPLAAGGHWKAGVMMPAILREVEHIVLMPRCARHVLAGSTLGLKAAVGYWRTDTRLEYHRDAATLQEKTAEANTAQTLMAKQRLVVSAADKILATFGPDRGQVHAPEVGLVMASQSVVAHDMVSLAWLLDNRSRMPADQQEDFLDHSPLVARLANTWVVGKLGGLQPAVASERLVKNDIETLRDDRVLLRAWQIFGAPRVALETLDNTVPGDVKGRLEGLTAL